MSPVILRQPAQRQLHSHDSSNSNNLGRRLPSPSPSPVHQTLTQRNETANNGHCKNTQLKNNSNNRNGYSHHGHAQALCPNQNLKGYPRSRFLTSVSPYSVHDNNNNSVSRQMREELQQTYFSSTEAKSTVVNGSRLNSNSGTNPSVKMEKPCFLRRLEDKTVMEGDSVELSARVQGATSVSWIRSGKILPNCPDFRQTFVPNNIGNKEADCALRIADVFMQDAGRFICKAYNSASGSTALCSARITVNERKHKFRMSEAADDQELTKLHPTDEECESANHIGNNEKETSQTLNGGIEMATSERDTSEKVISGLSDGLSEILISEESSDKIEVRPVTLESTNVILGSSENLQISDNGDEIICENKKSKNILPELENQEFSVKPSDVEKSELLDSVVKSSCEHNVQQPKNHQIESTSAKTVEPEHESSDGEEFFDSKSESDSIDEIDTTIIEDNERQDNFDKIDVGEETMENIDLEGPMFDTMIQRPECVDVKHVSSDLRNKENAKARHGPQVMGPSYILALKGETVHLRIKVTGHPSPVIAWSRAGKPLTEDDHVKIEGKGEFSSVNIENVNYDDSGRYVAKVENEFGTVIHTANLSVEGPPEPPSRPPIAVHSATQSIISVSWSGAPYDGGTALTGYHLLISQDEEEWTLACQSAWLTATIPSPEAGSSYRFRVHAENAYGLGPPSPVSTPVIIPYIPSASDNIANFTHRRSSFCPLVEEADLMGLQKDTPIRLGSYLEVYEKGEELGKGRFGTVFKVTNKATRKEFASKIIRCIKTADKEKVRQEVEIMNILRHPKLIELVDAFETAREIVIITEKINGGELFERVVADDFTLTEFDCVGFMRQIMDGVRFIHSKNIIHLDLKPENILCLTRTTYNIKIIDFGLSQKYDSTSQLRVLFGTPEFVSPEIINYEPISPASDMWALGVITYVLLSGLSPFMGDTDSETFANITAADFDFEDDSFSSISDDAKEFISALLVKRQEKRLTAEECLSHKWLAYPEPTKNIVIPTDKLKRFIIRRKWQKTGNAIRALGRITMLYSTRRSSEKAAAAAAAAGSATSGSTDSGISLSPTTAKNSCEVFEPEKPVEEQSEVKRVLQRQGRVDSSSLTNEEN